MGGASVAALPAGIPPPRDAWCASAAFTRRIAARRGAEQLERAGERLAKRRRLEARPRARRFEQAPAALDLSLEILPSFACGFEFLLGDAFPLRVEVRLVDLTGQPLGVPVPDALSQAALDVVVDHLGETAQILLDGLRLLDQHLQHAVLGALRQHEVMTAHLGGGLELAVDPTAAASSGSTSAAPAEIWPTSLEPAWFPAVENRGEGVFIQLRGDAVKSWLGRAAVKRRLDDLARGHKRWMEDRRSHRLFPGGPYVLLHTLSHLLIQTMAMRCGYL